MGSKKQKIADVQIDYGIIFSNYGEADQARLMPVKGGGVFKAIKNIRDIEFDGSKGKSMGNQVVDSIDASLSVTSKDASIPNMAQAMPWTTLSGEGTPESPYKLTCDASSLGLLPDSAYLKNITMFCKVVGGGYRKISIYNAMNESDFEFGAVPKGEGEIGLEYFGHWDIEDDITDTSKLFEIEDITEIVEPVV